MNTRSETPKEIVSMPRSKVTDLDVRPILRAGGEPFSEIMAAVAKTPRDGALKLRATFKPAPLFHVLGGQGWQHWIEHGEGEDWTVWFYHAEPCKSPQENPELARRLKVEGNTWYLDVRELSPPEPMELTLSVLEKLPRAVSLVQINERVPQFLLPILSERGFRYSITQGGEPGEVRLEIGYVS